MLTQKQLQLLKFIQNNSLSRGVPPSFEEMKLALNLRSKSGIHRLITGLEERGYLKRLPHRARALEIIKLPTHLSPKVEESKQFKDSNIHKQDYSEISLIGRIAAGSPSDAVKETLDKIPVPNNMLTHGNHFALTVVGASMKDAGIIDGDTAIIKEQSIANSGDIVVALINNNEATLKYFQKIKNEIILDPANKEFERQVYSPEQVSVQGRLIGLIRHY